MAPANCFANSRTGINIEQVLLNCYRRPLRNLFRTAEKLAFSDRWKFRTNLCSVAVTQKRQMAQSFGWSIELPIMYSLFPATRPRRSRRRSDFTAPNHIGANNFHRPWNYPGEIAQDVELISVCCNTKQCLLGWMEPISIVTFVNNGVVKLQWK